MKKITKITNYTHLNIKIPIHHIFKTIAERWDTPTLNELIRSYQKSYQRLLYEGEFKHDPEPEPPKIVRIIL